MERPPIVLAAAATGLTFALVILGSAILTYAIIWGDVSSAINLPRPFFGGPVIEFAIGAALLWGSIALLSARRSTVIALQIYAPLAILWTSFILFTLGAYTFFEYRVPIPSEYWIPSFAAPLMVIFEQTGLGTNEDPVLVLIALIYVAWVFHAAWMSWFVTRGPAARWMAQVREME